MKIREDHESYIEENGVIAYLDKVRYRKSEKDGKRMTALQEDLSTERGNLSESTIQFRKRKHTRTFVATIRGLMLE